MTRILVIALVPFLLSTGCKNVECGQGTIENNGTCVASDISVGDAKCGPFTELVGDQCVPMFPPTQCDTTTTQPDVDEMGVVTCVGTGGGFACPPPTTGKQTICGQIIDLETNQPFMAPGATCAQCTAATTTGPCSLAIRAFDAIAFGTNPQTAVPLATDAVYIDDCGRYKVPNITLPSGPFVGLGIDDADMTKQGPAGTTNTVGVATPKSANTSTKDFEGYVAKKAVTDMWESSGSPPMSGGLYMEIFRAARTGSANQMGVTVTRNGAVIPADDSYFTAAQVGHTTVDPAATSTGANGTALVINAAVSESAVYSAQVGPLPAECRWETHAGASLPFILFVQVYRPTDAIGKTCPL